MTSMKTLDELMDLTTLILETLKEERALEMKKRIEQLEKEAKDKPKATFEDCMRGTAFAISDGPDFEFFMNEVMEDVEAISLKKRKSNAMALLGNAIREMKECGMFPIGGFIQGIKFTMVRPVDYFNEDE